MNIVYWENIKLFLLILLSFHSVYYNFTTLIVVKKFLSNIFSFNSMLNCENDFLFNYQIYLFSTYKPECEICSKHSVLCFEAIFN